jgi:uncharacterized protein (TIGR02246 family)
MRKTIVALAVFVLMSAISYSTAASVREQPPSSDRAEDEAAIRKIVTRLQDGWNKGDGVALAAPFAVDADYVIVNGMRIKGRDEIAVGHQRIFDTVYKGSHNTGTVQSVRFLRDDVAVVHVEWHLKLVAAPEGRAMSSMVLTKEKGQWSIVAFHNTPIASVQR